MHFCSVFGSLINSLLSVINMLLFKPFFCFILLLLHLCIFLENIYNALSTCPTGTLEDNKHIQLMLLFYSLQNMGITVSWSWGDYKEYFTYKDHKHKNFFSFVLRGPPVCICVHLCTRGEHFRVNCNWLQWEYMSTLGGEGEPRPDHSLHQLHQWLNFEGLLARP